jgi:hypothetical protein
LGSVTLCADLPDKRYHYKQKGPLETHAKSVALPDTTRCARLFGTEMLILRLVEFIFATWQAASSPKRNAARSGRH